MGKVAIELTCDGTAIKQQVTRPADQGEIRGVNITLLSGTADYGSLFARISVATRSGSSLLYVANLAAGYISESSNVGWVGEFPLSATDELILDLWGTAIGAVVRGNVVSKREE